MTITPPRTGPNANATPHMLPNQAIAFPRSFSGKNSGNNDGPNGNTIAAPIPCNKRPKISQPILGAIPAIIKATAKMTNSYIKATTASI